MPGPRISAPELTDVVVVPGIDDSGPDHWQSRWQSLESSARTWRRLAPSSWQRPDLDDWLRALDRARLPGSLVIAHSLGCLAVMSWLHRHGESAELAEGRGLPRGVVLVATPDPAGPAFPAAASTFAAVTDSPSVVPVLMLSSSDDPYASIGFAAERARLWGAGLIDLGPLGHVNESSGLGSWAAGRNLVAAFDAGVRGR
jgi:predicted alpha/beta hydrolase family esterase